jgi:hypothetical protein
MFNSKFQVFLAKRLTKIKKTLDKKSIQYATEFDRLHNFKRAGSMLNCSPERALIGMFSKNMISILDMIDDIEIGDGTPAVDLFDEKITDAINYLILLECLMIERFGYDKIWS